MLHRALSFLTITHLAFAINDLDEFQCHSHDYKHLMAETEITEQEADEMRCCLTLPCKYDIGCWDKQMPPLYAAIRSRALTKAQSNKLENELLLPTINSGNLTKTHTPSMPDHYWWRISVDKVKYSYFYDGIKNSFLNTFGVELKTSLIDLDIFYVDDWSDHWSDDQTYISDYPGAGYWIHNDCPNFRICYEESGYKAHEFTGNGVAFVLPVALSGKDFNDGYQLQPAALELYNISNGHTLNGQSFKPPNREWMKVYRYNLGEIIYFNAFRYHSGHVPRRSDFVNELNKERKRAETVGFAAEHKDGFWVLFRMCKGSTNDYVKQKIVETDINQFSTGVSDKTYMFHGEL